MRTTLALLSAVVIAAAGCGPSRPDPQAPAAPTVTPPAAGPSVSFPLVSYVRQGGIGGADDRLTVAPDGAYEVTRRGVAPARRTLPAADLAGLRRVLEGSGFADIPSTNSGGIVADGYTYYVEYGGHTVMAEDGAVPEALAPVLTILNRLLEAPR